MSRGMDGSLVTARKQAAFSVLQWGAEEEKSGACDADSVISTEDELLLPNRERCLFETVGRRRNVE